MLAMAGPANEFQSHGLSHAINDAGLATRICDGYLLAQGCDDYPSRNESAQLLGEDWDFDDDAEMAKRLPKLYQLYDDAENAQ